MINIHIKSIPVADMRIPGSLGDYWYDDKGALQIRVAETGNVNAVDYETLIAIHEMTEEWLTKRKGLTEPEIQAFDAEWDAEQREGKHPDDAEPGFDIRAPYLNEHTLADAIERLLCAYTGISINDYEAALENLS